MRVIYLSAPVSGDVVANLARAKRWLRWILETQPDVAPMAPWISICEVLDDAIPANREHGLRCDMATLARCDENWLVAGRVSTGMALEAAHAERVGVIVVDLTHLGEEPPVHPYHVPVPNAR